MNRMTRYFRNLSLKRNLSLVRWVPVSLCWSWADASAGAWLRVLWAADQDAPGRFETTTEGCDAEIRESTSFLRNFTPQAGRSLEAGLRYSF